MITGTKTDGADALHRTGEVFQHQRFGFIALGDDEPDVFMHITACDGFKPQAGDRVSFSIVPGNHGNQLKAVM
jgi:cold shock CspA family protein